MIVLTFQPQFVPLVESGKKCQTIRGTCKRPIKVGDELSLRTWTGRPYMSPQRLLRPVTPCIGIGEINIDPLNLTISSYNGERIECNYLFVDKLFSDHFAQADGFTNWEDLVAWFDKTHGLPFSGVLIQWGTL